MPEPKAEHLSGGGLASSLRRLAATAVAAVETRFELLVTELEEERVHLFRLVVAGTLFLFCLAMGMVLLTMFVVVLFWDTHRLAALGIATGAFLASALFIGLYVRGQLSGRQRLLSATRSELRKDRERLIPEP